MANTSLVDGRQFQDEERENKQESRQEPRQIKNETGTPATTSSRRERSNANGSSKPPKVCQKCGESLNGQFVRALGGTFHLNCFRCEDCNDIVASKFFPVEDKAGQQVPLCETDYFRRLDLLCHNCGGALRGSYVTALEKKYHIEHFTCSACPTAFGPDDNYYEYDGEVYCHYHYSARFAQRCTGCETAILKQFVEIFRNGQNQHWHPECYMIHKFWNVKLAMPDKKPSVTEDEFGDASTELRDFVRNKEEQMEDKTYRIWSILSAFEETSASCISDMLLHVSNGATVEGVVIAKRFIDHIDLLFAAIDHLNVCVKSYGKPSLSYGREAKLLCKRVVAFFNLLSKTQDKGVKKLGVTQELLSLVTGLAHYLKLLIRISLQAALKLERETTSDDGLRIFLDDIAQLDNIKDKGFSIEDPASVSIMANKMSDQCAECNEYIDDECLSIGIFRWHTQHLQCSHCFAMILEQSDLANVTYNTQYKNVLCSQHSPIGSQQAGTIRGCQQVTRLQQYVHLLHVALARLLSFLRSSDDSNIANHDSQDNHRLSVPNGLAPPGQLNADQRSKSYAGTATNEQSTTSYEETVGEMKRLRSQRLEQRLSVTGRKARQSRLIEDNGFMNGGVAHGEHNPHGHSYRIEEDVEDTNTGRRPPLAMRDAITLDDIPRIVAAEQAKEQRPNAYRHAGNTLLGGPKAGKLRDGPGTEMIDSNSKSPNINPNGVVDRPKRFFSELSPIEYFIVRHVAVIQMQPLLDGFYTLEDLLSLIESRNKQTFWGKMFKNDKAKTKKKKGVFGIGLEILNERDGAESTEGVSPGALRVPAILDDAVTAMKQMDMSVEGVFRKNGNIKGLRDLAEKFDAKESEVDLTVEKPVQVAALLKKFLRELPDPLLTHKLHEVFTTSQKINDPSKQKRLLHLIMCLLPKPHRDASEILFTFLTWCASFSADDEGNGSKMDAHNLATVMTPNILRPVEDNSKIPGVDESFLAIEAVYQLIEYNEEMCRVPEDITAVLNDSDIHKDGADITTKEILKRYGALAKKPTETGTSGLDKQGSQAISGFVADDIPPIPVPAMVTDRGSREAFTRYGNSNNDSQNNSPRFDGTEFVPPNRMAFHHSNGSAGSSKSLGRVNVPTSRYQTSQPIGGVM